MKELTEAERKFHLANCCRWRYDGYTIDDEGLPNKCFLTNETNPYLPRKIQMVPKRTCRYERHINGYYEDWICSECGHIENNGVWNYCPKCGAEILHD